MDPVSCEGLHYWVTCNDSNHHSASKYNFPEMLNWYNQFKCSNKNREKGWGLSSSQKEQPCRWLLFGKTISGDMAFPGNACNDCRFMWMGWFCVITMRDWALSVCGRALNLCRDLRGTNFYFCAHLSPKARLQNSAASALVMRKLSPWKRPLGKMAFSSASMWLKISDSLVRLRLQKQRWDDKKKKEWESTPAWYTVLTLFTLYDFN